MFTDWFRQEFDVPVVPLDVKMWNFECSTVAIFTPLVFIMKDKVKELSSLGLKAFAIGTGNEEVFSEDNSSIRESANLLEFVTQD